jgi:hypothetical protein
MRKKWIPKEQKCELLTSKELGGYKLAIHLDSSNLSEWVIAMHLLLGRYVDGVVFPLQKSPMRLDIRRVEKGDSYLEINRGQKRIILGVSVYHLENCMDPFIAQYYVDGRAAVEMDHFEFPSRTVTRSGVEDSVAIYAEEYIPPMSAEEATRRLLEEDWPQD